MNLDLILIEIILWTIAILAGMIAYEFYKSKDGKLRILIISLFVCKVYLYGGAAIWFLFTNVNHTGLIRSLILNFPMFCIMLRLYKYVRTKE